MFIILKLNFLQYELKNFLIHHIHIPHLYVIKKCLNSFNNLKNTLNFLSLKNPLYFFLEFLNVVIGF